jgi:hypothetical protein
VAKSSDPYTLDPKSTLVGITDYIPSKFQEVKPAQKNVEDFPEIRKMTK